MKMGGWGDEFDSQVGPEIFGTSGASLVLIFLTLSRFQRIAMNGLVGVLDFL